jgi:hypothetical protein
MGLSTTRRGGEKFFRKKWNCPTLLTGSKEHSGEKQSLRRFSRDARMHAGWHRHSFPEVVCAKIAMHAAESPQNEASEPAEKFQSDTGMLPRAVGRFESRVPGTD